ncbi:cell division protein FtsQ/DivIB [Endozoicomonas ascidiicola]|uniref:cell division protein FtsQ/DivIB n=1 Tax=Endozoicomonas ascidiicola TaxID=1698521 RepID=UPI00082D0A48|nr:cell division protein FtsQ/DivIB [Endozoicomonas ascidiicola]
MAAFGHSSSSRGATRSPTASLLDKPEKRRLNWKRVLQLMISAVFISGVLAFAPRIMDWLNQPIARVEVHSGFEHQSRQDVEKALEPMLQARFFSLDLESMQEALLGLPWVKEASVRKQWPDRVMVNLEERRAIARWGNHRLISNEGVVFEPNSLEGFSDVPVLAGADESAEEVMQQYLAVGQLLRPIGLRLKALTRKDSGSWSFVIGHVQVNIGRDRQMERLQRLTRLYHTRLESQWSEVDRVDLRYLNGAAVAWRKKAAADAGL